MVPQKLRARVRASLTSFCAFGKLKREAYSVYLMSGMGLGGGVTEINTTQTDCEGLHSEDEALEGSHPECHQILLPGPWLFRVASVPRPELLALSSDLHQLSRLQISGSEKHYRCSSLSPGCVLASLFRSIGYVRSRKQDFTEAGYGKAMRSAVGSGKPLPQAHRDGLLTYGAGMTLPIDE
ncbi:hypothetical protein MJG53_015811 [Ovis ammon polii x Ovis aries]|uniref:Uncharacterized protein n=1 Tax=Ovis ammon polii x Ovis aries TaxID=2918886 RepID=A0ACB9UC26_9CETA|nr:hypothetical protein MJG53_015811 [Ovis ammon polii x Ovis aries]